ncbi:MAG: anti-sigma F factor antagonist [Spirochaetes bacterium]|nr:MAG: anti-sigma F factor antagonist [Spirochaetota bacterium]
MEEIVIKDSLKITPMQIGGDSSKVQLILNGYLDTYNSPEFQSHINSMIESGVRYLIFNCNGLTYISSTGIGAFTSFLKQLKQKKGDMVLFGLQSKVMEVFELLGFTKFFKIASDFDEATEMLTGEKTEEKQQGKTSEKTDMFPLIFQCPYCGKKLKTSKPGKFKCSGCGGIFTVSDDGKVNPV